MSRHASELTDEQWSKIEPLIPKRKPSKKGGRKRIEDRRCFEGILWVLRSGARWKDLPERYPSPATCWRRLQEWEDAGVWLNLWRKFLGELDEEGILPWDETFSDGTFSPGKKGAPKSENQTRKGYKAHGGGRRPGCTSGSSHCPSVPGGSHAHRVDARASSRPAIRPWPSTVEATTADLRQGRRQRRLAAAAQETRDRVDLPSSLESQKARAAGWSFAPPLPPPVDDRKDRGMARKLPPAGRSIRAQVQDVPGFPEGRLPVDHPSTVLKPLLGARCGKTARRVL